MPAVEHPTPSRSAWQPTSVRRHGDPQGRLSGEAHLPQDRLVVTESGIASAADVALLRANGIHAFLVGETFMRAPDPGEALRDLFGLRR